MVPDCLERAKASDERRASGKALGLLEGIPMSIKENLCYKGLDSTIGFSSRVFHPMNVTQAAVAVSERDSSLSFLSCRCYCGPP